jgi:hypothetical protein
MARKPLILNYTVFESAEVGSRSESLEANRSTSALCRTEVLVESVACEEMMATQASALSSFATGIASDRDAVRAALTQPWSNGQTTKLKLVKRQMYGRANLDLLQGQS